MGHRGRTAEPTRKRAAQTRTDYERGLNLDRFSNAVKRGKAKPLIVALEAGRRPAAA